MSDMTPGEVAKLLGVNDRTLRRYADVYETVHGPLPKTGAHRRFPAADVERLAAGVAAFRERPGAGLEAALRGEGEVSAPVVRAAPVRDDLAALRLEVQELRDMLKAALLALRLQGDDVRRIEERLETLTAVKLAGLPEMQRVVDSLSSVTSMNAGNAVQSTKPKRDRHAGKTGKRGSTERLALSVPYLHVMQRRMPRGLGWKPEKYAAAEALLSEGDVLRAEGVEYLTERGNVMNWRTAEALVKLGVLVAPPV